MSDESTQLGLLGTGGAPAEAPRGAGRPKGARNKRGRDWQALAATMSVHPIEFMLRTVAKSERELAEELELFKRDEDGNVVKGADGKPVLQHNALLLAHGERRAAAREVLPYVEQKLPALEDPEGESKRILMIVGNLSPEQERQAQQATGLHFGIKQNQRVIDAEPVQSDGEKSDDDANTLTINEDRGNDY